MSKFHTVVSGCGGNIVVGDHAVLNVGALSTGGKKMKFLYPYFENVSTMVEHFTSGFFKYKCEILEVKQVFALQLVALVCVRYSLPVQSCINEHNLR